MSSDTDLELATLDQIADELGRRFESVLVVCDGPLMENPEVADTDIVWRGEFPAGIGLAVIARRRLLGCLKSTRPEREE